MGAVNLRADNETQELQDQIDAANAWELDTPRYSKIKKFY